MYLFHTEYLMCIVIITKLIIAFISIASGVFNSL